MLVYIELGIVIALIIQACIKQSMKTVEKDTGEIEIRQAESDFPENNPDAPPNGQVDATPNREV